MPISPLRVRQVQPAEALKIVSPWVDITTERRAPLRKIIDEKRIPKGKERERFLRDYKKANDLRGLALVMKCSAKAQSGPNNVPTSFHIVEDRAGNVLGLAKTSTSHELKLHVIDGVMRAPDNTNRRAMPTLLASLVNSRSKGYTMQTTFGLGSSMRRFMREYTDPVHRDQSVLSKIRWIGRPLSVIRHPFKAVADFFLPRFSVKPGLEKGLGQAIEEGKVLEHMIRFRKGLTTTELS